MFISAPTNNKKTQKPFNILSSGLFEELVSKDSKNIGLMSGFTHFDYTTAYKDFNHDNNTFLPNGGMFPRIYSCIGESGTGKTTTMIQVAGSIADRYWGGTLMFIDAEGNTTPERIKSLCHWDDIKFREKCVYIPPSPPITINDVYNYIRKICHAKDKQMKNIKCTTPFRDIYSHEKIEMLPPTIVILDSVPALVIAQALDDLIDGKKDFKDVEKIAQNVDGLREGKDNTSFLRKVKPFLDKYNISLVLINHLTKELPMGMFDRPKKFHPNLKAGEKLKGGSEQIYQSFALYKMTPRKPISDFDPIFGKDIRGNIVSLELIKNKSQVSSSDYRFIFDKKTGFRPEISDFHYLFESKFGVSGSPASMKLDILPEVTFTRKTLLDKCKQYPILSRAISFTAKYYMGNELIMGKCFGELDLKKFGELPIEIRTNVICNTTIPYPGYVAGDYLDDDAVEQMLEISAKGDIQTSFEERFGGYVSPINVDVLKTVVDNHDKGMMSPINGYYDPFDAVEN